MAGAGRALMIARSMPVPRGPSFVLGWLLRYARDPYGVFAALVRRYQDPFFVKLPETRGTVVTGHPEGVKAIVSADNSTLVPWRLPATEELLTLDSIFLQAGDRHHATRKMLAPLFHSARQGGHCAMMGRVVATELDALRPGPIVVHALAQEITLRIVLAVLFGSPASAAAVTSHEARVARFRDCAERLLDRRGPTLLYLPWLRRRSKRWARYNQALPEMRSLVQVELDARRGRGDDGDADMLGQLMRARRPDGTPLPDREITIHLADLVIAGHETTTVAVAWACYELCRHPEVMARVVAELDGHKLAPATTAAAAGCPHAGGATTVPAIDGIALTALPYLAAVCNETLRLHPPLVFLSREVAKPLVIRGHEVPPGHGVSIAVPLVHRNQDVYGDPDAFRPERFVGRTFGPEEFLPFGGGAKRCLGATFAHQEMMVIVAGLLTRFRLRLRHDRPARPRPRVITVAPGDGVHVVLERRAAATTTAAAPS